MTGHTGRTTSDSDNDFDWRKFSIKTKNGSRKRRRRRCWIRVKNTICSYYNYLSKKKVVFGFNHRYLSLKETDRVCERQLIRSQFYGLFLTTTGVEASSASKAVIMCEKRESCHERRGATQWLLDKIKCQKSSFFLAPLLLVVSCLFSHLSFFFLLISCLSFINYRWERSGCRSSRPGCDH